MPTWIKATGLYVPSDSSRDFEALLISTYHGSPPAPICRYMGIVQAALPAPGVWNPLDFSPIFPPGVNPIAVGLGHLLVITDGSDAWDTCIAIRWQRHGAGGNPLELDGEGIGVGPTGGARTNEFCICPLDSNGLADYSWLRGNSNGEYPANALTNPYPAGSAYSLWVTAQLLLGL